MKKIAQAAAAIAILMTGAAYAADMAVKARPVPVPVYSWTGCYVGGNAGWIAENNRYDVSIDGSYLLPSNIFSDPANSGPLAHSYSPHSNSATVGVQAGCNYQTGKLVIGGEADLNWSGLRDSVTAAYGLTRISFPGGTVSSRTEVLTGKYDWYSTIRGRIGTTVINPALLLYATGGVAIANIQTTTNIAFANDGLFLNGSTPIGAASVTKVGWAAGVGGEYAFSGNWTVKAEYLHLDFGNVNYLSPCMQGPSGCAPAGAWRTNVAARAETVRVGINYHFGTPVVAKY